jgi:histidinol-phosphate aminotransferase
MSDLVEAVPEVASIPPYHPGLPIATVARQIGIPADRIIKLASNENPRGMSHAARRVLEDGQEDLARYPDPDCFDLRAALSGSLGIGADHIMVGAGSSEILGLIARGYLGPGRAAVIPQYAFGVYEMSARSVGASPVIVPAAGYGHDLEKMLAAIDATTRVVYLASPNNPTGTSLAAAEIESFLEAVPANVLVVLDEAYREYMRPELRPDVNPWLERHPNLIVLRTFSKIYGLAGLRVGYAIASPAIVAILQRLRSPFSVSVSAQAAGVAALNDVTFIEEAYRQNLEGLDLMCRRLKAINASFVASTANFVLIQVGNGQNVYSKLLQRGLIVRPMASWGLPDSIRVTIGTPSENDAFLAAIEDVMNVL